MDKTPEKDEQHQFVERVFVTFSWRSMPEEIWAGYEENWEYDRYNDGFNPVHPRAFDFQVFESHPFNSQGDTLCFMSVEGYLYYLPSFISLIVEDVGRSNDLGDSMLGTLRSFPPYVGPIANWVSYLREQPPLAIPPETREIPEDMDIEEFELHMSVEALEDWFVNKAKPSQCERIAQMTQQEREIVAQFLDMMVMYPDCTEDAHEIQSVQSILRNESYSRRLGARTEDDVVQLLALLEVAASSYPLSFPPLLAESIKRELERAQIA